MENKKQNRDRRKGSGGEEGADFSFKKVVRIDLLEKMTIVQRFRAGERVSL